MQEIKKIWILPVARIFTVIGFILGILQGILAYAIYKLAPEQAAILLGNSIYSQTTGVLDILTVAVGNALAMFIMSVLLVFAYNFFASRIGGISIELNQISKKKSKKK